MNSFNWTTCCTAAAPCGMGGTASSGHTGSAKPAGLPPPAPSGNMSVEQAMAERRSGRAFADRALTREHIAQLCWAGQGISDVREGLRTVPSAGALYPLELYVVTSLGVDHYDPQRHRLTRHVNGDGRRALQRAALEQEMVGDAPLTAVIAAVVQRSAKKYGARAERYCFMEAGHAAQNMLLQAAALKLVGVPIGAFDDKPAAKVLNLPRGQRVLYLLPIGHPR